MYRKLEELRNELNKKIEDGCSIQDLLPLSIELDKYIYAYMNDMENEQAKLARAEIHTLIRNS